MKKEKVKRNYYNLYISEEVVKKARKSLNKSISKAVEEFLITVSGD